MPSQEEHDKPENLVESPAEGQHSAKHSARSLEDAADSNATLQGYYAMNNIKPPEEVVKEAAADRKQPEDREKGDSVP